MYVACRMYSVIVLVHDMIVNDMRKRRRKSRPNINNEDEKLLNDDIEPVKNGDTKVLCVCMCVCVWGGGGGKKNKL